MSSLLEAVGGLATQAAIGRVLLAWLPPGPVGGHALHQLAATWGTSHALGAAAWVLERRLLERLGIEAPLWGELAPWVLVLVLRLATLPAAMVPRHEPARAAIGHLVLGLYGLAIALVWLAFHTYRGDLVFSDDTFALGDASVASLTRLANALALLAIVAHGLECARAVPWMRALATLAAAGLIAAQGFADGTGAALALSLWFSAGMAFTIPWLRRADTRARALAIVFFAASAAFQREGFPWALGGGVFLVSATPNPARTRTAIACAVALALGSWLGWSKHVSWHPLEFRAPLGPLFVVLAISVAVASSVLLRLRSRAPIEGVDAGSGFAPRREERVLAFMITLAFGVSLLERLALDFEPRADPLFVAIMGMTLVLGLGLKHFAPRGAVAP